MKDFSKSQLDLWKRIEKSSKDYQLSLETIKRKQLGVFYTHLELTDYIIETMFDNFTTEENKSIYNKKFLEPCVGIGNFVFSYLKYIYQNFSLTDFQICQLINNIYVCESDNKSKEIYLNFLEEFVNEFFNINIDKEKYALTNIGGALIFNIDKKDFDYIGLETYFGETYFDFIVTNPPYKNLRAEKKHYDDISIYEADKNYYSNLKHEVKLMFFKQGKGSINLYKLFVEEIISKYLNKGGFASLLVPQSILKDQSSFELRKLILQENTLLNVTEVNENSKYIDAKQALASILLRQGGTTESFSMISGFGTINENKNTITKTDVEQNMNSSIVMLNRHELALLKIMHQYPRLKNLEMIQNLRGELDLTLNKKYIQNTGGIRLLRGRNLFRYDLKNIENLDFINTSFLDYTNKEKYIHKERISCPQISNMNSKKRLFFSYVPEGYILGNSCNFISVSQNDEGLDLYYLLGLFNSDIYDWYFKIFSSNNHINNYEIDELPVPMDALFQKELSNIVKNIMGLEDKEILMQEVNNCVNNFFEISLDKERILNMRCIKDIQLAYPQLSEKIIRDYENEVVCFKEIENEYNLKKFDEKVINSIILKYNKIDNNEVLNHTSFKLSELDMEMVSSVKPGGNWKQIPLEVAEKSKRLMGIRKTGGRTTLYGRLDYEKQSYTITTYFNRPGNGTNIHPVHDRVLSVREAARIQSFPDDYMFYGNKKNRLNQIGNAVPPLMAYQIAKKIKAQINVGLSLDLFNGAGGMTTGFKMAGYTSILANDIDEAALVTAKVNYPSSESFLGDITNNEDRNYIISKALENEVDIVIGGPPCQGFSLAGVRDVEDPRSKLIFDYFEVIKEVKPKVFVFENVQGILSHSNGETFQELLKMFSSIGYKVEAKLLNFSDFYVPQRRKRVIIIGVDRSKTDIDPKSLFPDTLTEEDNQKITVRDAIEDLQDIQLDSNSYYNKVNESQYVRVLKGIEKPENLLI